MAKSSTTHVSPASAPAPEAPVGDGFESDNAATALAVAPSVQSQPATPLAMPARTYTAPANLPDYLAELPDYQTDMAAQNAAMSEYVVVARMKIIQAMSASEMVSQFGVGSVVLTPGNAMVVKNIDSKGSQSFDFTPLFFYTEYCKWKDLNDKSDTPMIVERSFDRKGALAARCQNPATRSEGYGNSSPQKGFQYNYRFVEHLNFTGIIQGDHPLAGQLCAISCSRGEFATGRTFVTQIMMRKTPAYTQVWSIKTGFRDRGTKKWWGWDIVGATPNNNIARGQLDEFRFQYLSLKEAFETQRLQVDLTDGEDEGDGLGAKGGSGEF